MLDFETMMMRGLHSIMVCLLVSSWALPTLAIDDSSRAASRKLVNDGVALFQQGRYADAKAKFMTALDAAKVPTVAVWAAQAHEKLGQLVAALELYEHALLMQPNDLWVGDRQQRAQQQAEEAIANLKTRIAVAKLRIDGIDAADVTVSVDGVDVPVGLLSAERPLDPGEHVFVADGGGQHVEKRMLLAAGDRKTITLTFSPAHPPSSNPPRSSSAQQPWATQPPRVKSPPSDRSNRTKRVFGWAGVGLGAAGLGIGVLGGVLVAMKHADLENDGCSNTTCTGRAFNDRVANYNGWRTASTAGFVIGGFGLATGLTLLFLDGDRDASPKISLTLGPDRLSFQGEM